MSELKVINLGSERLNINLTVRPALVSSLGTAITVNERNLERFLNRIIQKLTMKRKKQND